MEAIKIRIPCGNALLHGLEHTSMIRANGWPLKTRCYIHQVGEMSKHFRLIDECGLTQTFNKPINELRQIKIFIRYVRRIQTTNKLVRP